MWCFRNLPYLLVIILGATLILPGHAFAQDPAAECDRLAGHPDDTQGAGDGVLGLRQIDVEAAAQACDEAIAQHPDMPRFKFQRARVMIAETLRGNKMDCRPAVDLLTAAIDQDHAEAAYQLAWCGLGKHGLAFEFELHYSLLHQSADMGSGTAKVRLARAMVVSDEDTARTQGMAQLAELAGAGNTAAMVALADLYSLGAWVESDPEQAHRYRLSAAERGHLSSQYYVGVNFIEGQKGAPQDIERGRAFLKRAAEAGHRRASWRLSEVNEEHPPTPEPAQPKRYKAPTSGGLLPGSKVVK